MKLADLINIHNLVTARGKSNGFAAKIGSCSAFADTRSAAIQKFASELRAFLQDHWSRAYIPANDGKTIFVVYRAWNGWAYDIVAHDRTRAVSVTVTSAKNHAEATAQARSHAENYA